MVRARANREGPHSSGFLSFHLQCLGKPGPRKHWRTQGCCLRRFARENLSRQAEVSLPPWPLSNPVPLHRKFPGLSWGPILTTPSCPELHLDENCAEAQDGELDGLWTTITIFITLFLLSVCYSATVTFFKVGILPPMPVLPMLSP